MSFPFYLIAPVLKFLKEQKPHSCTLVYPYLTPLSCWWPILQSLCVDKFSVREDAFSVNERLRYLDNLIDSSSYNTKKKKKVHWKKSI